jgi:hypothetical protein
LIGSFVKDDVNIDATVQNERKYLKSFNQVKRLKERIRQSSKGSPKETNRRPKNVNREEPSGKTRPIQASRLAIMEHMRPEATKIRPKIWQLMSLQMKTIIPMLTMSHETPHHCFTRLRPFESGGVLLEFALFCEVAQ